MEFFIFNNLFVYQFLSTVIVWFAVVVVGLLQAFINLRAGIIHLLSRRYTNKFAYRLSDMPIYPPPCINAFGKPLCGYSLVRAGPL